MVTVERLREVGIFRGITDKELELVGQSVCRIEDCKQDTIVCTENAESTELYIVDSGRVNLEIEAVPEMRLQVSSLKRNEVFGWEALVPPYRYTTTARAVVDSGLIVLEGEKMRKLCETYPDICARVMEHVVRIAADQLAATRQQMFMLYHAR